MESAQLQGNFEVATRRGGGYTEELSRPVDRNPARVPLTTSLIKDAPRISAHQSEPYRWHRLLGYICARQARNELRDQHYNFCYQLVLVLSL